MVLLFGCSCVFMVCCKSRSDIVFGVFVERVDTHCTEPLGPERFGIERNKKNLEGNARGRRGFQCLKTRM